MNKKKNKITPYFYVMFSFLAVILIGTLLLYLPISTHEGFRLSFLDAFFTSVSATCVTGLSVVTISETLTVFGKVILAILIEIGGLSFLTIAAFVMIVLVRKLGITSRFLMKEALNQNSAQGIMALIRKIIVVAAIIQFIFIIINTFIFMPISDSFIKAFGLGAFHTISSFNNAGFDILGDSSLINYSNNIMLNISTIVLIILGGLGFIVITDIFNFKKKYISFHSKIVLTMTSILIVFGTLFIKLLMGSSITWLEALFTSVTTRTAGFTTIDLSHITEQPAFIIILVLMFIGASPCSTGGGIKTTTTFTMVIAIFYMAIGKKPKAFNRSISIESILKAFTLSTIGIFYCVLVVFIVYLLQTPVVGASFDYSISSVIFEVVSAFGTVGLSVGLTPYLTTACKLLICLTMFIGRLGPLTIVSLWNNNWMKNTSSEVKYIEEKIMIG